MPLGVKLELLYPESVQGMSKLAVFACAGFVCQVCWHHLWADKWLLQHCGGFQHIRYWPHSGQQAFMALGLPDCGCHQCLGRSILHMLCVQQTTVMVVPVSKFCWSSICRQVVLLQTNSLLLQGLISKYRPIIWTCTHLCILGCKA